MKKIFLILALTALMSIGVNAEENKVDVQQQGESASAAPESSTDIPLFTDIEHPSELNNNLGDSFMAAFGMEVDAGGSGEAAPSAGKAANSRGKMGAGMSNISSSVINQVSPPFTPYSYQHNHQHSYQNGSPK